MIFDGYWWVVLGANPTYEIGCGRDSHWLAGPSAGLDSDCTGSERDKAQFCRHKLL